MPGEWEVRTKMIKSAATPAFIFGADLYRIPKKNHKNMRTAATRALKPKDRAHMNPAAIRTMTLQGHSVDPAQAEIYAAACVAL